MKVEDPTLDLGQVARPPTEPPATAPQRGDTVGRYMVVDLLGMGGMGIVYKAFDPVLNRAIALKVLLLGDERQEGEHTIEQRRGRALREAQALARLTHSNVVAIYDVGVHDDRVFMAMELIEGETLAERLKARKHSRAELLEVITAAGQGLSAANHLGIIHRDFKPTNVLIGNDGRVRVIDFGLARADDHAAPTADDDEQGLVLGTPSYMSPEQQEGKPLDASADQFSFAVVLFEVLHGQRPFAGETFDEVAANARTHTLRRNTNAQVPPWLDAIATRGLSPDPKARFGSIDELLAALADDPDQRRRRTRAVRVRQLGLGFAATLVGLSLFFAYREHQQTAQMCRGAEGKLVGIWDDATKRTISAAFAATQKSFAAQAYTSVRDTLDAYARSWSAMHTEACEAASMRHEQSAEIMTLRMNCLAHRLGELKAASSLLQKADAPIVQKAQEIAEQLSSVGGCGDVEALSAPLPPPRDAPTRAKVEQLRDELAKAKVLGDAAKFEPALLLADAAAKDAAAVGYRPVVAEAQLRRGVLLNDLGRYAESLTAEREAFLAALASKHAEVMLRAATELVALNNIGLSRPADAESWGQIAKAILASGPANPEEEARWLTAMGTVYLNDGKYDKSIDHLKRGLAIRETLTGPGSQRAIGTSLLNLGVVTDELGDHDQARAHYLRALAIWEKELGPDHPSLSYVVNNLGILAWESGDYPAAETYYRRAMKIDADTFGADAPGLGLMIVNLALLYHDAGREADALDHYRRALALTEKRLGAEHTMLIWSLQGIGRIAAKRGQLDEARARFDRILQICGAEKCRGEEKHALAEADFGLAKLIARGNTHEPRARALALEARGFLQQIKSVGATRRLGEVDAWLGLDQERRTSKLPSE